MSADPDYLDANRAEPFFAELKRYVIERLDLAPGDRALDVGCGTGEDVADMAAHVGSGGTAIGIDLSADMIQQAMRRFDQDRIPVKFQLGDAHNLPFRAASFAGCRTERTLQHVHEPARAIAEVYRVLHTGGRFVAAEPDWGTTLVVPDDPSVARTILARWAMFNNNPTIGRDLCGLLLGAGFRIMSGAGRCALYTTFDEANDRFPLESAAAHSVARGLVTEEAANTWIGNQQQASADGAFLFAVTIFIVTAVKP